MKNHVISLLNFLGFKRSFSKENRLVFKTEAPSSNVAPEVARQEMESREKVVDKYKKEMKEKSGEAAKSLDRSNPIDNVLDKLSQQTEPGNQDVFKKLLDGKITLPKQSESAPEIIMQIKIEDFSEFQFTKLLNFCEKSGRNKDANYDLIFDKIKPEGPFNVLQIGREAMKLLLDYAETKNDEKVKQIVEIVSKSPTRLSELIGIYASNTTKLKNLLQKLGDDYHVILKDFVTNYPQYLSQEALLVLINNWQKFLEIGSLFSIDDLTEKLPLETKVDLMLSKELTSVSARGRFLDDLETNHINDLIAKPALIEKLFTNKELKEVFMGQFLAVLKKEPELAKKMPASLVKEFLKVTKDEGFLDKLISNISNSTKIELIDTSMKKDGVGETILVKLNPDFGKAIEKLQLVRDGEEFRGTFTEGAALKGTLTSGKYYFQGSALDKVFYRDPDGAKSSIKIENLDDKPQVWKLEETAPKAKDAEIKDFDIITLKKDVMTYENGADATGKPLDKDTTFKIKKPLEIIAPSEQQNATLKGIACVRIITNDNPPKERLVKLSEIDLKTGERTHDLLNKDQLTTRKLALSQDDGAIIASIDGGKRVTVTSPYIKKLNGVDCVKVRFHEQGKEGWVEKALLAGYDQTTEEVQMEKDGVKDLRDKYFPKCSKVEKTERTIKPETYHVNAEGATINSGDGSEWQMGGVKFDVKDPAVYKVTEKITDQKDQNKVIEEIVKYVVKFENARNNSASGDRATNIPNGYIEVSALISGSDTTQNNKPERAPYDKTEWTKDPVYTEDKSISKGSYTPKAKNALLLGAKGSNPEEATRLEGITDIKVVDDQKVRLVDKKEYVKVTVTAANAAGDLTGWMLLEDINVNEATLSSAKETATVLEKSDVGLLKKDEFLKQVEATPGTYTVDFKQGKTEVDKKLEKSTKLHDIFPAAEDGDKVEITHGEGAKKIAIFDKGDFYYLNDDDKKTSKHAVILDGDKVTYIRRATDGVKTMTEIDDQGYRTARFRDSQDQNKVNKGLERNARLRDMLDTSKLVDGDRVIIIREGKKDQMVAVFKKEDGDGGNFYFTEFGKETGKRATILDGDKFKLEPKDENTEIEMKVKKEKITVVGTFELPQKGETIYKYVTKIYEKYPAIKAAATELGYTEQDYYTFLTKNKANGRFEMKVLMPIPGEKKFGMVVDKYLEDAGKRDMEMATKKAKKAEKTLEGKDHYYDDDFDLNKNLFNTVTRQSAVGIEAGVLDERWNDLWEHRGEFKDKYITGLNKVVNILRTNFGINDAEMRDTVRNLIQEGMDYTVTFKDVFKILCKKLYTKQYKENYGKETDWDKTDLSIFKEDINTQRNIIQEWDNGPKREDKLKIQTFYAYNAKMQAAEQKAKAQGTKLPDSDYREWDKAIADHSKLNTSFQNEYIKASKHLNFLVYKILVPATELLESIKGLGVGKNEQETAFQTYQKEIDKAKQAMPEENPAATSSFYNLEQLTTPVKGDLAPLPESELKEIGTEGKEKYAVSVSEKTVKKFQEVAKACGITEPSKFTENNILKLVFQLYGVNMLTQSGCLKKIKDKENQLALVDLPENFKKDSPEVQSLFKGITTGADIDAKPELVKETKDILDKNAKIMKKLSLVFGGKAPQVFVHWTEKWTGGDSRAVDMTMADIGAGEVTEEKRNFFLNHMSGESAIVDTLARITKTTEKGEELDENSLTSSLKEDLKAGIKTLPLFSRRFKELKGVQSIIEQKGELTILDNGEEHTNQALLDIFNKKIDDFISNNKPLDEETLTLIRLGHIARLTIEQNTDKGKIEAGKEYILSSNEGVRVVQELMIQERNKSNNLPYTQDDLSKIESGCLLAIGGSVGTSGTTGGLGIGKSFALGDGWSVGVGAGIGVQKGNLGGAVGVGVEKTIKLSKDGKTQLILGVDGGYPGVGGHAGIKFAITESWSMTVMGAAGWSPLFGDYEGAGFSWKKEGEWERQAKISEEQTKIGTEQVDGLIKEGAPESAIAAAICVLPRVGKKFAALKTTYSLSDKGIIQLYQKQNALIKSEITQGVEGEGWGFGVGIVRISALPFPIPNLYVEFPVEKKVVVYRTLDSNSRDLDIDSQGRVNQEVMSDIKKRYGEGVTVTFMDEKIGNIGECSYDVISGEPRMLRDKGEMNVNFKKYDKAEQLNEELKKINIELSVDKTGLTRIDVNKRVGDVQFIIDPEIQEQLVVKNGATYITMTENPNLIITRENFFYPYAKEGAREVSIITIKKNPLRTRDQIQQESPLYVLQRKGDAQVGGYTAQIEKGLSDEYLDMDKARREKMPMITSYEAYKAQKDKLPLLRDPEKFAKLKAQWEKFQETTGLIKSKETEASETVRKGIVEKDGANKCFAEDFYKNHHKEYKKLATKTADADVQGEELNKLIQGYAAEYKLEEGKVGTINKAEMSATLNYLMTKSFMDIHGNQETFQKNLEKFGEKQLTVFFNKSIDNLKKLNPAIEIKRSANLMARTVVADLRSNTNMSSPAETTMVKIDGTDVPISKGGLALLSLVGTEGVVGLRGTPTYDSKVASGLLNLKKYDPSKRDIEGDIGKVLLETINPLNAEDDKKFMESKLAITTIVHPGIFLALGAEKAQKVAECFRDKTVSNKPGYKEAYEQFKRIVLAIRNQELTTPNGIITANTPPLMAGDLADGYRIQLGKAPVAAVGVYKECGNPTIAYKDSYINILSPKTESLAKEGNTYETITPTSGEKVYTLTIGISLIPEAKPEQPKPQQTPKENETATGANATADGTGATMAETPAAPAVIEGDAPVF